MCALLLKSMYGTMDASHVWQSEYSELLSLHSFTTGKAWPSVFRHSGEDLTLLVHGDDFFVLGDDEGQSFMKEVLKKRYEFRTDGYMGMDESDDSHVTVLNRLITLDKKSGTITFEADPRRAEMIVPQLGLDSAKAVATPNEKKETNRRVGSKWPATSQSGTCDVLPKLGDEGTVPCARPS